MRKKWDEVEKVIRMIGMHENELLDCRFVMDTFPPESTEYKHAKNYIDFKDLHQEVLDNELQEKLAEMIDLSKIKDRDILFGVLDTADKDEIWSFMEDDIEHYVNGECVVRVERWED